MSSNLKPVTDILKSRLRCVTKEKVKNQRIELSLRNTERNLMEELTTVKSETEFLAHQMEDVQQQISELKYQIEMIEICRASENEKVKHYITYLNHHKNGFDELMAKENELLEIQKQQLHHKEAEAKEIERQKTAKFLEFDEQLGLDAACIENECEEIERECGVLTKRNRAIMLQLRRKLIESEVKRRELMKQTGVKPLSNN